MVAALSVAVALPSDAIQNGSDIVFTFPENAAITDGSVGRMNRFVDIFGELKNRYADLEVTEDFGPLSVIFEAIGYHPENAKELITDFNDRYNRLPSIIEKQEMPEESRAWLISRLGLSK